MHVTFIFEKLIISLINTHADKTDDTEINTQDNTISSFLVSYRKNEFINLIGMES